MKEINSNFIANTISGFYCEEGDFYIDPKRPVKNAVISHAHADHAIPGSSNVYSTEATFEFMKLRYRNSAAKVFNPIQFYQSIQLKNVKVTFIPAGHMLGSAQIVMECQGVRYLYSGDVKAQEDSTCEPIEYSQADVLITESTFANPMVIHPNPIAECEKIVLLKKPLAIGCYVLGKAQRINMMINKIEPNCEILIHHDILAFHKIYERFGFLNANYKLIEKKNYKQPKDAIYLLPPLTYATFKSQNRMPVVFASGWKNLQENNKSTFYLSDHMDWNDLIYYIQMVNPREIWTIHGDGKYLMEHFINSSITVKKLN